MGVESFLLVSTLRVAIGQRLVRKLADDKVPYILSKAERDELANHANLDFILATLKEEKVVHEDATWNDISFYHPKDNGATEDGYHGRMGIHEVFEMSSTIKDMIMSRKTGDELEVQARKEGMLTMMEDGIYKAAKGLTSIEEVLRVISE
jgi:type IV pilus assembly protein PilB